MRRQLAVFVLVLLISVLYPTLALGGGPGNDTKVPAKVCNSGYYAYYAFLDTMGRGVTLWVDNKPIAGARTYTEVQAALDKYKTVFIESTIDKSSELISIDFEQDVEILNGIDPQATIMSPSELLTYLSHGKKYRRTHQVTEDDSLSSIANRYNIDTDLLVDINKNALDSGLEKGLILQLEPDNPILDIKAEYKQTYIEPIPYKTLKEPDPNSYVGTVRTKQRGEPGISRAMYTSVYLNSEVVTFERIERKVIRKPINTIISYGTKKGTKQEIAMHEIEKRIQKLTVDTNVGRLAIPTNATVTLTGNYAEDVANMAHNYLGARYILGTAGPITFDCSGLLVYLYKQAGAELNKRYIAHDFYLESVPITKAELKVGDLGFIIKNGRATHVGVYVGEGLFVDASSTKRKVVKRPGGWNAYGRFSN